MSKLEYMCKGSWALGTACGKCQKCILDAPRYIAELQEIVNNMQYMVIHNEAYEGAGITVFDTRVEADNYLYISLHRYIDDSNYDSHVSDYRLIEFTQEFDVRDAVEAFRQKRDMIRTEALAKLNDEEKAVLGLTKV